MKEKILKISHFMGTFLTSFLIICFSLLDGKNSSSQSRRFTNFVYRLFNQLAENKNMINRQNNHKLHRGMLLIELPNRLEYFLRKSIGHFFLFFILSYFVTMSLFFLKKKNRQIYIISLLYGLLIAIMSELLQYIPLNRGPSLSDVFLNYSGYILFVVIFSFVNIMFITRKNQYRIN